MNEKESYLYSVLFDKVKAHMKWDDQQTALWWTTENPLLGKISPVDYYILRPEKCTKFVECLIEENTDMETFIERLKTTPLKNTENT